MQARQKDVTQVTYGDYCVVFFLYLSYPHLLPNFHLCPCLSWLASLLSCTSAACGWAFLNACFD